VLAHFGGERRGWLFPYKFRIKDQNIHEVLIHINDPCQSNGCIYPIVPRNIATCNANWSLSWVRFAGQFFITACAASPSSHTTIVAHLRWTLRPSIVHHGGRCRDIIPSAAARLRAWIEVVCKVIRRWSLAAGLLVPHPANLPRRRAAAAVSSRPRQLSVTLDTGRFDRPDGNTGCIPCRVSSPRKEISPNHPPPVCCLGARSDWHWSGSLFEEQPGLTGGAQPSSGPGEAVRDRTNRVNPGGMHKPARFTREDQRSRNPKRSPLHAERGPPRPSRSSGLTAASAGTATSRHARMPGRRASSCRG